jgi:hypothetical protein
MARSTEPQKAVRSCGSGSEVSASGLICARKSLTTGAGIWIPAYYRLKTGRAGCGGGG